MRIYDRLGLWVLPRDFQDIGLKDTLQYQPYKDDTKHIETFFLLQEEVEPMLEEGDQYLDMELMLLRRDKMARGKVVACIAMKMRMLWVKLL